MSRLFGTVRMEDRVDGLAFISGLFLGVASGNLCQDRMGDRISRDSPFTYFILFICLISCQFLQCKLAVPLLPDGVLN